MISTLFTFDYVLKELLADHRKEIRFFEWPENIRVGINENRFFKYKVSFDFNKKEWSKERLYEHGWADEYSFKPSEMNKYGWEVSLPYNKDYPEFQKNDNTQKESLSV